MKDKKYYDDFFVKYGANVHNDPERFLQVAELLHGRVLDVACGTGNLADYFKGDYVGVDISEKAIEIAKKVRRKNACFFVADYTQRQISISEKYDSFYLGEFLEHIENDDMVFENILSCAKDGARVVVSVPNGDRVPDESHCRTFTVASIRRDYSKYGFLRFWNWSGFKDRIIFTIDLCVEAKNDLTLVMCVKDEEKGLENAIISALPLVDRVIVSVDIKSSDRTLEIAEQYADEVLRHEFLDDFSKMRNAAHKNVKTKWILFLDGHEYIDRFANVRDFLKLESDGIMVTIRMENGLTFMYPRIYKNGIQFKGSVHNELTCKTLQYCPKFLIVHDRSGSQSEKAAKERDKQRKRMVPKIMKEALAKDPNDHRALFHLANFYMTAGEFKLALKYYKRCFKLTPSLDEKYFVKMQIGIARQLLGRHMRAQFAFRDCDRLIPNRWETKKAMAVNYMMVGSYSRALPLLVDALEPKQKRYIYQPFGYDLAELWDLIAICFNSLGRNAEAVVAWEEAKKATDDPKRKDFFATKAGFAKMLVRDLNATISFSSSRLRDMHGSTDEAEAKTVQTRSCRK